MRNTRRVKQTDTNDVLAECGGSRVTSVFRTFTSSATGIPISSACLMLMITLVVALRTPFAQENPGFGQRTSEGLGIISRENILAKARQYAEHEWKATADNVFHGLDRSGIHVDTPDKSFRKDGFVVATPNHGIPYKWGGFSTLAEFDQGIREGRFAGHLRKDRSPGSAQAVGVDCSGLVSQCWDLPRKHSTRSLGNLCYELESYDDLLPGDILNRFDRHVMIFESFVDETRTTLAVYEAVYPRVKRNEHSVVSLKGNDFRPLRYMPLHERWKINGLRASSFQRSDATPVKFVPSGVTLQREALENPFTRAGLGEWANYKSGNGVLALAISRCEQDRVVVSEQYSRLGKSQFRERNIGHALPLVKALIESGGFDQDFGDIEVLEIHAVKGECSLDGRVFDSTRIRSRLQTSLLTRGIHYPVEIAIDCLLSKDLPVHGVLSCEFRIETKRGTTAKTTVRKLELLGCSTIQSRESRHGE